MLRVSVDATEIEGRQSPVASLHVLPDIPGFYVIGPKCRYWEKQFVGRNSLFKQCANVEFGFVSYISIDF